ncbi:MAG: serine hydrolase [Woeseiaceae bacterium]|nr:serine hydrolase [Woeseiaceae bacterium]
MRFSLCIAAIAVALAGAAHAYPLDGGEESGIRRLEGYALQQQAPGGAKLWPGQLLGSDEITLALTDYAGPDFDELPEDPALARFLAETLRPRDPSYGMVVVDYTDPDNIRWAGLRADLKQNPGSVGKIICMAGLFHALAQAFPDPEDRARVLRETVSRAGDWVWNEIHKVPKWNDALRVNQFSVINARDEARLSEWLDHAISASANGAGSIIWREAMLIREFGVEYPQLTPEARAKFFAETPKSRLGAIARAVVTEPLEAAGIDTASLQQGSMWTGSSKQMVPGTVSYATPRELARFMFRIEQGRLVDEWSSLEMKKYMYLTKRRYRYAYAPELGDAAVYFKSGSLYSCQPEEGFRCEKYMGNVRNLMNSVSIVEGIGEGQPHYIAALMSNVLRFNSAWDHSRIAAAVHKTILTDVPQALKETASQTEISDSGRSD